MADLGAGAGADSRGDVEGAAQPRLRRRLGAETVRLGDADSAPDTESAAGLAEAEAVGVARLERPRFFCLKDGGDIDGDDVMDDVRAGGCWVAFAAALASSSTASRKIAMSSSLGLRLCFNSAGGACNTCACACGDSCWVALAAAAASSSTAFRRIAISTMLGRRLD